MFVYLVGKGEGAFGEFNVKGILVMVFLFHLKKTKAANPNKRTTNHKQTKKQTKPNQTNKPTNK